MDAQFDSAISYALEYLRYPALTLKTEQRASVSHIYNGKDVFVWLLIGFGKSLCYELLPCLYDTKFASDGSLVVLVSPLVSLMVNQTESLRKRGVRAAILSSAASKVDKLYSSG